MNMIPNGMERNRTADGHLLE